MLHLMLSSCFGCWTVTKLPNLVCIKMLYLYPSLVVFALVLTYLWLANHAMTKEYLEVYKYAQKPWRKDKMKRVYDEAKREPIDVRPFLPPNQSRRYIVLGGSGLVGGWIVQHLLDRGTPPTAIRILDLRPPTRPEVSEHNIAFFTTDVTSTDSLRDTFTAPWPSDVANLPFTIIHCVAIIGPADRKETMLDIYVKVNIEGTKNVLAAAQDLHFSHPHLHPTVFIATSSGSISPSVPTFLPAPFSPSWFRTVFTGAPPTHFCQILPNAEPIHHHLLSDLSSFGSCYAFSKARGEYHVRRAHDPSTGFLTGCIRPAHGIYGHGVENPHSLSYDYLRRGGAATWMSEIVTNFVDARNVSLGHLWYEHALLSEHVDTHANSPKSKIPTSSKASLGGKAYAITDPNPPLSYAHIYTLLSTLSDPRLPVRFPIIPPLPMLLLGYIVESYVVFRHWCLTSTSSALRKLARSTCLPMLGEDLMVLQPGLFQIATLHLIYTDDKARTELGYVSCVDTMRGLVDSVLEWNGKVEEKMSGEGSPERNITTAAGGGRDGDGLRKRGEALSNVSGVKV